MARLKNITSNAVVLQLFSTASPTVNYTAVSPVISLGPGEDIDESTIAVTNINNASYNTDIINNLIAKGILTRLNVS